MNIPVRDCSMTFCIRQIWQFECTLQRLKWRLFFAQPAVLYSDLVLVLSHRALSPAYLSCSVLCACHCLPACQSYSFPSLSYITLNFAMLVLWTLNTCAWPVQCHKKWIAFKVKYTARLWWRLKVIQTQLGSWRHGSRASGVFHISLSDFQSSKERHPVTNHKEQGFCLWIHEARSRHCTLVRCSSHFEPCCCAMDSTPGWHHFFRQRDLLPLLLNNVSTPSTGLGMSCL